MPIIADKQLIPPYQLGFRPKYSRIKQIQRIIKKINNKVEAKKYCSTAIIDISQAFDKVWHDDLLYKMKTNVLLHLY